MHLWGKMVDNTFATIAGRYEVFVGELNEISEIAKEVSEQQIGLFRTTDEQLEKPMNKQIETEKTLIERNKAYRKPVKSKTPAKNRRQSRSNG